jgi:hypothetical protein
MRQDIITIDTELGETEILVDWCYYPADHSVGCCEEIEFVGASHDGASFTLTLPEMKSVTDQLWAIINENRPSPGRSSARAAYDE